MRTAGQGPSCSRCSSRLEGRMGPWIGQRAILVDWWKGRRGRLGVALLYWWLPRSPLAPTWAMRARPVHGGCRPSPSGCPRAAPSSSSRSSRFARGSKGPSIATRRPCKSRRRTPRQLRPSRSRPESSRHRRRSCWSWPGRSEGTRSGDCIQFCDDMDSKYSTLLIQFVNCL